MLRVRGLAMHLTPKKWAYSTPRRDEGNEPCRRLDPYTYTVAWPRGTENGSTKQSEMVAPMNHILAIAYIGDRQCRLYRQHDRRGCASGGLH